MKRIIQYTNRRFYEFEVESLMAMLEALGESHRDSAGAKLSDEIERELLFRAKENDEAALSAIYNSTYPIDTRSLEEHDD